MALWPYSKAALPPLLRQVALLSPGFKRISLHLRGVNVTASYSCACSSSPFKSQHGLLRRRGVIRNNNDFWNSKLRFQVPFLSQGCANHASQDVSLPPIMDFPPITWPKLINTLRNWFFTVFVIRPYMDREFSIKDFDEGARQALTIISNKLAKGEYEDLEGLVESAALDEIKKNMANFSVAQRELLKVDIEDIFFSFPYEIGIIIPDRPQQTDYIGGKNTPPQVRHVEVTVVFHVLRGMSKDREELQSKTLKEFIEDENARKRIMICNYRFFRDFTEGKDATWIVNVVNHFIPAVS